MKKYQMSGKMGRMSGFTTALVISCFYKYLLNTGLIAVDAVYVHDKEFVCNTGEALVRNFSCVTPPTINLSIP